MDRFFAGQVYPSGSLGEKDNEIVLHFMDISDCYRYVMDIESTAKTNNRPTSKFFTGHEQMLESALNLIPQGIIQYKGYATLLGQRLLVHIDDI